MRLCHTIESARLGLQQGWRRDTTIRSKSMASCDALCTRPVWSQWTQAYERSEINESELVCDQILYFGSAPKSQIWSLHVRGYPGRRLREEQKSGVRLWWVGAPSQSDFPPPPFLLCLGPETREGRGGRDQYRILFFSHAEEEGRKEKEGGATINSSPSREQRRQTKGRREHIYITLILREQLFLLIPLLFFSSPSRDASLHLRVCDATRRSINARKTFSGNLARAKEGRERVI